MPTTFERTITRFAPSFTRGCIITGVDLNGQFVRGVVMQTPVGDQPLVVRNAFGFHLVTFV